ncbi:zf-HC2 domain-containing protein [Paenibacillus solani]|uniref:anti-sigma factor n=1 Tax=Paenibacillus solani TaxID=1705565 RepID=UPI003D2AB32C
MNCQEVVERMHRYLDRDLTPEETAEMYQHIAVCPECAETFSILKSLNRELEELPAVTPPVSLVDAIMPRLDAIDRERQNLDVPPAVKIQEPAEMMPEIRRPRRKGSWWSTVGGRTAVGAAAAVMILGAAILTYEPKMLSDAEVPYEAVSTTGAGTTENGAGIEYQDQQDKEQLFMDGGMETGGAENEGSAPSVSQRNSPPDSSTESDPDSITNKPEEAVKPAEPSASTETEDQKKDAVSDPATQKSDKADKAQSRTSDQPVANETNVQNNAANQQTPKVGEPQQNEDNMNIQKAPTESMDTRSDKLPPISTDSGDPAVESHESSDQLSATHYGLANVPEQWSSPDGLYTASVEVDQLVIYRLPSGDDTSPEAVETVAKIPLKGSVISGQWSDDGLTFKYKLQNNGELVEHVYSLEKEQVPASTADNQSKPKK